MLLVDYRSGSKELIEPLRRKGLKVDECDLHSADIAFIGRGIKGEPKWIGIEAKKVPDLMQSMRDGRLAGHQIVKMQDDYDFKYLFIEGPQTFDKHGRFLRFSRRGYPVPIPGSLNVSEVFKRLSSLHIGTGTTWQWFPNRTVTVQAIHDLYRTWTDKDQDAHTSHIAIYDAPTLIPISGQRQILCKLPGVSLKVSRAAIEHFGNVRNAINASAAEWAEVQTIDKRKKARRLGDSAGLKIEAFVTEYYKGGTRAGRKHVRKR